MDKRSIINFLFILSFPVYGIGAYVSGQSPSIGYIISVFIHILIFLFYCIDALYKTGLRIRLNWTYAFMLTFLISSSVSLFIAFNNGLPEVTSRLIITKALLVILPFHSFIAVTLYNDNKEGLTRLLLIGLSVLLALNLVGYFGLGLTNVTHSIEGRVSFPFLDAFYSGAGLIAIINLLLIYYLRKSRGNPIRFSLLGIYFLAGMAFFYFINSRLAILIFLFILILMFFGAIRIRGLFILSMFTIPILLSSGMLLYSILKTPAFESVLQRISIEDVTTFNGRAYLWQDAIDWLLYDQRGLFFGNGFQGHYFLGIVSDVVKLWNVEQSHHLHLHSTSLEILVSQGLIMYILYCVLFYRVYVYYRDKHKEGTEEAPLFPVVVFLLFMMQVDTFLYLDNLGSMIFALLVAKPALTQRIRITEKKEVKDKFKKYETSKKEPVYDLYCNSCS